MKGEIQPAGRLLTTQELKKIGITPQQAQALGAVRLKGEDEQGRCQRCGAVLTDPAFCPLCRASHGWCEACANMGLITSCTDLWLFPAGEPTPPQPAFKVKLDFILTPFQKRAAAGILDWLRFSPEKQALLWAACGAGKTEVIFPALALTLNRGQRALLAVPRREIVVDLQERIKKAFPAVDLTFHYGGQPELARTGALVVATTHQVLRFRHCFALVIVDEVDAFPYRQDERLALGVERSLSPGGKMLTMTATPDLKDVERRRQARTLFYLPLRHHGQPLPEPEVRPDSREELLLCLKQAGPWLVFVASVREARELSNWLKEQGIAASGVWAADPAREEKIKVLKTGHLQALVTTTLLERGITIPGVNVIVWRADRERIFERAALIQISGRVGRTADRPGGRVIWLAAQQTGAMREALESIRYLNRIGREGEGNG
ncbi:MAG: DEAD/DEAH box helicase [Bacillota bacterium]